MGLFYDSEVLEMLDRMADSSYTWSFDVPSKDYYRGWEWGKNGYTRAVFVDTEAKCKVTSKEGVVTVAAGETKQRFRFQIGRAHV